MKKLIAAAAFLTLWGATNAFAWNPITDVRDNLQWTFGQKAEVGEAVKLAGAGDLDRGDTATSFLAGIADYRFLTFSYGGIRVNRNDAIVTDTFKTGFRLTSFFDLFKNQPTPEMTFMRNLNIGPALSMPVIASNCQDASCDLVPGHQLRLFGDRRGKIASLLTLPPGPRRSLTTYGGGCLCLSKSVDNKVL